VIGSCASPPKRNGIYLIVDSTDPEVVASQAAKHRLVEQTRRLIERVALFDQGEDETETDRLADRVAALVNRFDDLPNLRSTGLAKAPGVDRVIAERSPYAGRANPLAPPMRISFGDPITSAEVEYTAAYEGPHGAAHGGVVAAAFDTLFGVAHRASGLAGVTGSLTVDYRRPTPLFVLVRYDAWVTEMQGRKVWCRARSTVNGELVAEASCLFITRVVEVAE
jgi:acyl-coenzyme A thioesterase PaaI-like protein